ncbi:hypothetical protein K3495_g13879, partial [Podosphaera aphanis]
DRLAREALAADNDPTEGPELLTLSSIKKEARSRASQLKTDWWTSACPSRYAELEIRMRRKKPPEFALPKALYARLLAACTGHGDFAAYHRRWNHESATLHCICEREKSAGHLTEYRRALANWRTISGRQRAPALNEFLGEKGWQAFSEYVLGSGIYNRSSTGAAAVGLEKLRHSRREAQSW